MSDYWTKLYIIAVYIICFAVLLCTYILFRAWKPSIAKWCLGVTEEVTSMSLKGKWRRICLKSFLTRQSRWAQMCYFTRTATWMLCSCNVFSETQEKDFLRRRCTVGGKEVAKCETALQQLRRMDLIGWETGVCVICWYGLAFCFVITGRMSGESPGGCGLCAAL